MSFWKRSMEYLGLGPDDAYDDYDEPDEPDPRRGRANRDETRGGRGGGGYRPEHDEPTRAPAARPSFPSRDFDASARRGQALDESGTMSRPRPVSAPPSPARAAGPGGGAEPSTVRPRRFDQAQELADKFKDGQSVILNLESTDREVARRLIDFASGVCYSLDGTMEKVATGVYLLKPAPQRAHRFDDYED